MTIEYRIKFEDGGVTIRQTTGTFVPGGNPKIRGAGGNPEISGAGGNPEISGAGGNPEISGAGGNPEISGAGGNPEISGAGGATGRITGVVLGPLVIAEEQECLVPNKTKGLRRRFEMQEQQEGHWCWAAVSASVDQYLNPAAALAQCAIASEVLEAKNCCSNQDEYDEAASLEEALRVVNRLNTAKGGRLEFQDLQSELDADRPVCIAIEWNGGGAHFVAVSGYQVSGSGIRTIEIGDPLYPNSTQDFDLFPADYHGGGEWAATFLTTK
jgi:papain like cysteine protease AvrRpt2